MSTEGDNCFTFLDWQFDHQIGLLQLNYHDSQFGTFSEQFTFPQMSNSRFDLIKDALYQAINCLHWMAGVSYFKTSLATNIKFANKKPNLDQASWLTQTWQSGLAELAYQNQLPWLDSIAFNGEQSGDIAVHLNLKPRSLVAIGGGKDSLVSIEMLKSVNEEISLFMVGQSKFIQSVALKTKLPLVQVLRQVDPRLSIVNQQGAYNGHIPITAINSAAAIVAALVCDYDSVIFSNERSADIGNVKDSKGRSINHQYSKSFEFELTWQAIVEKYIAKDLNYFSILRPFSELAIIKKFAKLEQYFPYFSSCNRNFHLTGSQNKNHHWCGQCPKCAFVFLCLAPFIRKDQLLDIFHNDLLADQALESMFASLLGFSGIKPFECVGEDVECRAAIRLLASHEDWQNHHGINKWFNQIKQTDQQDEALLKDSQKHQIPSKRNFLKAIKP